MLPAASVQSNAPSQHLNSSSPQPMTPVTDRPVTASIDDSVMPLARFRSQAILRPAFFMRSEVIRNSEVHDIEGLHGLLRIVSRRRRFVPREDGPEILGLKV